MGIQHLNHNNMRFLIVAALCAIASAAPEGRRLRPEEHWRPAQGRDLSKYKPRAAMVDANGDDLMEKINRVAAEMRASVSPSNKKDLGKEPKAACGIEGPARKEVTLVAPWCRRLAARQLETSGPRSELSPSEPLPDVRLACPPDSPGPSTTWTGSSPRLECLEDVLASLHFPRKYLKIKDLLYEKK